MTDGTRRGTSLILDGAPPSILTRASFANPLWVESLGLLFFLAGDSEDGYDLWRSDGTSEGTFQVKEASTRGEANLRRFGESTEFRGRVFFHAQDFRGPSLWTSDGTAAGTTLVRDPVPNETAHAGPSWLRVVGSRLLFFFPTSGLGVELLGERRHPRRQPPGRGSATRPGKPEHLRRPCGRRPSVPLRIHRGEGWTPVAGLERYTHRHPHPGQDV